MPKKAKQAILLLVTLAVIVVAFLSMSFLARLNDLAQVTPPTLEVLQALDVQPDPSTTRKEAPQSTEDTGVTMTNLIETALATTLPTRLERTPSLEELTAKFKKEGSQEEGDAEFRILKTEFFATVLRVFGREGSFLDVEIGLQEMKLGDWDSARLHLWAAVDVQDDPDYSLILPWASAKLAWLEDDPEKAARYLELSTPKGPMMLGGRDMLPMNLRNAISLCKATGSTALRDHYQERLSALDPD